jgi:hypothetical protein
VKSAIRHTRKKRRQNKAVIKHGKNAKRSHRRIAGRTGSISSKQMPSKG